MADNTVYKLLSAEIKALSSRISKQDEIIAVLQNEVIRLSGGSTSTSTPSSGSDYRMRRTPHHSVAAGGAGTGAHFKTSIPINTTVSSVPSKPAPKRTRPVVVDEKVAASESTNTTISLSTILNKDETVTIEVGLSRDESGAFDSFATCLAKFDGSDLSVSECSLASELVGFKTNKPGEVLYRFMDALLKGKHIKSKFACPPWKLCSVMRDGAKTTLDELRSKLGGR